MKKIWPMLVLVFLFAPDIFAGPRDRALFLHRRLTGITPSKAVLDQMHTLLMNDQDEEAVEVAMQNPLFYNLRLKQWFKAWSNIDSSNRVPFNDFVATAIGLVRDDIPFNQILYGDILYIGGGNIPPEVAPYSPSNNDHFRQMEVRRVDLQNVLVQNSQSALNNIADTAGVLTSRAAGEAFFSAGTNRRVTRYAFINFLCHDFEALHDITVPDFRVRRDVDRRPGGDSRVFKSKCVGCHAGQDALGGAFSYFDFVGGALVHTPNNVVEKINRNNLFSDGHVTVDDSWLNLWATGQNQYLGFRGSLVGNGARALGTMLAQSSAFSQCMARRAYKMLCLKESPASGSQIATLATSFETNNYSMRDLLTRVVLSCPSEEDEGVSP